MGGGQGLTHAAGEESREHERRDGSRHAGGAPRATHSQARPEALDKELREAAQNLPRALDALAPAPENAPDVAGELLLAQNQWRFMDDALRQMGEGKPSARDLEFIAKAGDNLLESMERIARAYAGAS